jgi:hypothetical protein
MITLICSIQVVYNLLSFSMSAHVSQLQWRVLRKFPQICNIINMIPRRRSLTSPGVYLRVKRWAPRYL